MALGLLAFDLAGRDAAAVLGAIFTIKMIAYVGVAPIAGAFADRMPRRAMLVSLDAIRAGVAIVLPFVTEIWQVYTLIFVLQAASAAFTPTFQATIPDILPEEKRYTRALSLSRLAYDLENIISPTLAALLLAVFSYIVLFVGTALGFVASAVLILSILLPSPKPVAKRGIYDRTTRGIRIYLATPRLRGLLALNLVVSACGAMVLVNSVVLVRGQLALDESALAWTMGAFGAGSMIAALALPKLLDRLNDRPVMLAGAAMMISTMLVLAAMVLAYDLTWPMLLVAWAMIGIGFSTVQTPSGRLLRRSSHEEDRPAIFAAQFALSHACWLLAYPLAGWLMTVQGTTVTLTSLAGVAGLGLITALGVWPVQDKGEIPHLHDDLPVYHPHIRGKPNHAHPYIIDDLHRSWPSRS